MPTISSLDELLANLSPYLKSARPLEAMKKAGFSFKGEVGRAVDSVRPAIGSAAADRLEKDPAAHLPICLRIGETTKPSAPPVSRIVVGGFRATESIDLDSVNPVIDELYQVGTIPNAISASDTASLIDLSTLFQLCENVPSAPDTTIGDHEYDALAVLSFNAANPDGDSAFDASEMHRIWARPSIE